jgi:phytoene dehydrogenase-like protein
MRDNYDVIIIGAGMGGLTCGAWLSHKRIKVLVVEQNVQVGGLCSSYKRKGFNFTPAASIITGTTKKDGVFERLITQLGIEKELEFIPLEQGYHVHLPDFNYYLYSGGEEARQRLIEQLIKIFPHETNGIKAFFDKLVKIYEQADYATFLGTSPMDVARILFKCPTLVKNMGRGIVPFVNDFVKDPKLKTVLSINSTCANLPPSRMSLLGIAGLLIEGGLSNPHLKGGSQTLSETFAKSIRDSGGEVLLGHLVEKILIEDGKAHGVRIKSSPRAISEGEVAASGEGKEIAGKYIVSNAAARQTFQKLVGEEKVGKTFLKRLGRLEPTPPYCALFLGLDMDLKKMGFVPALHIHSSTYDTDEHFKNVAAKLIDEQGPVPFFRLQLAPLSDPTSAPEGKTALVIHFIPVPSTGWDNPDWEKRAADLMVRRVEKVVPDLSKHIVYQELWSPLTIDNYALSGQDASIGWALTPTQVGPKRLAQQTPIKNLLLSGHWTRPALGVMSTVISGLQAAKIILAREGINEPLSDIGIKRGVMTG